MGNPVKSAVIKAQTEKNRMHFNVFPDKQEQPLATFEVKDDSPTSTSDDKWEEFKAKKNTFLSNLKSKFSNQERRSSNGKNGKVFIPAVHVFMQPNVIHQRKKMQRKTSCPDMTQTRVKVTTIPKNSSLPILSEASEQNSPRKKFPSESSATEQNYDKLAKTGSESKKVVTIQRLQSVDEGHED